MNLHGKFAKLEGFGTDWRRLLLRGAIMLILGAALSTASVANPEVMLMHAREFSWLPAAAFVVLAAGVLECFDAAIAREPTGFFIHLPIGVLDLVLGGLIVFSISGDPARLSLMIAAFLLVKGIIRMTLAQAARLPHKTSTVWGASISVILGWLIWLEWPSSAGWFLAFCLSVDIGLKGWALMMFGLWLRQTRTS